MIEDWGSRPNPEADEVARQHNARCAQIALKTLSMCECGLWLTDAISHTGARIKVTAGDYGRFVVSDGKLHVASGTVLRSHDCAGPALKNIAAAKAAYEDSKGWTEDDFDQAIRRRAIERRNGRRTDVPDPIPGARSEDA